MSDKIFRGVIVANVTVAVIGGLILGGLYVASQQPVTTSSNPSQRVELTADLFTRSAVTQTSTTVSTAMTNMSSSIKELAESHNQFANAIRYAGENGRYQQVQAPAAEGAPVQFFDTRTGEIKPTK